MNRKLSRRERDKERQRGQMFTAALELFLRGNQTLQALRRHSPTGGGQDEY